MDIVSILFLIPLIIIFYTLVTMFWGAGYGPSPKREVSEILGLAYMICCSGKSSIEVIDLGSGFGGVCFEAVKLDPRVRCLGVEIDPIKVLWSRFMARIKGVDNRARFVWGNMFNISLEGFDVVYMFLWPSSVERLEGKIVRELRRGGVAISLEHRFRGARCYKAWGVPPTCCRGWVLGDYMTPPGEGSHRGVVMFSPSLSISGPSLLCGMMVFLPALIYCGHVFMLCFLLR